jgi:hypothetical protein
MATRISGQNDRPGQSFAVAWQDSVRTFVVALQQASTGSDERQSSVRQSVAARRIAPRSRARTSGLRHPARGSFALRGGQGALSVETTLGGHIVRRTGMAIDTDGAPNVTKKQDRNHRKDTSMTWDGQYVDASTIPYMVMPLGGLPAGVQLGDIARVSYNGRVVYAIIADRGGRDTKKSMHGEGSIRLAQLLGINADPNTGGAPSGVTYEIVPGSGRRFGIYNGGPAFTNEQIQAFGMNAFDGSAFAATA